MRIMSDSNGEWYEIIEELVCPFNEKKDYIILKDGEIIYWQNANDYPDIKRDIEQMKSNIRQIENTKFRSETRKQKRLTYQKENLNKMIAYKRQIKIEEVLDKTPKESVWLAC